MDVIASQSIQPEESSATVESDEWMGFWSSPVYTLIAGMLCGGIVHQLSRLFTTRAVPPAAALTAGNSSSSSPAAQMSSSPFAGLSHKMVLVVRTDLGMQKGKAAAQCAHAALGAYKKAVKSDPQALFAWEKFGQTKVCLKTDSESSLLDMAAKARELNIPWSIVKDAGRTQVEAGSLTVLGIGPAPEEIVDQITGHLKLY